MGLACLSAGLWGADKSTEAISLIPDLSQIHDLIITIDSEGVCQIQTTGTDPYLLTLPLPETFDPQKQFMLSFDYITEEAMALQVFFAPSLTETGSLQSSLSACKEWTCFSVNLTESRFFTAGVRNLRLDFGQTAGRALQIRNLFLRPPTPQEKRIAQEHAIENQAKQLLESGIRAYLKNDYPCQIHRVAVDANSIQIRGNLSADWDQVYLCQALPDQILFGPFMDPQPSSVLHPILPFCMNFDLPTPCPNKRETLLSKFRVLSALVPFSRTGCFPAGSSVERIPAIAAIAINCFRTRAGLTHRRRCGTNRLRNRHPKKALGHWGSIGRWRIWINWASAQQPSILY